MTKPKNSEVTHFVVSGHIGWSCGWSLPWGEHPGVTSPGRPARNKKQTETQSQDEWPRETSSSRACTLVKRAVLLLHFHFHNKKHSPRWRFQMLMRHGAQGVAVDAQTQGRTCLDILWGGRRGEEGGPLTPTTRVKPLCLWASEPHPFSFGVHSLGTSSFRFNGTFCKSVLLTLLISILREARSPALVTVCSRSLSR